MPYSKQISRAYPTCFLFLVDQSASMEEPIGRHNGTFSRKCDMVADALNRLLMELTIKSTKGEGDVRDYFHIGVSGYGAQVGSAFGGSLAGRDLLPISEIADNPVQIEERIQKKADGAGGVYEDRVKFPIWVQPVADNGTPMADALQLARDWLQGWLTEHPECFPPIVLNLTDGEANEDPAPAAAALRELASDDGQLLLFNLHVSSTDAEPITFPDREDALPDDYARALFRMSSPLPPTMHDYAVKQGYDVGEGSRGFIFNADVVTLVQFLDIGTKVSVQTR